MKVSSFLRVLAVFGLALSPGLGLAEWNLNFKPTNTILGHDIEMLHNWIMWIILVDSNVVFGAMFY